MSKHKIFISPGHNEFTFPKTGAKGGKFSDGVYEEFDTNIAIANKLNSKLKPYNKYLDIIQLEYDNNKIDMGLSERINYINKHGSINDFVVSLHANYNDNYEIDGQWGFYVSESGFKFLNLYMKNVKDSLIKYTRTYKCVKNTWTSFGIVLKTKIVPAVLLEFGFFSNKKDRNILKSPVYHEYCAEKVMLSILQYFNIKKIQTPINLNWEKHLEKTSYPEQWKNNIKKGIKICNEYNMGDLDFVKHLPDLIETIGNK